MIYTIGYDHLKAGHLQRVIRRLGVGKLVDCRSVPTSRIPGFGRRQLESALGDKYEWRPELGGRGAGPTKKALRELVNHENSTPATPLLLMCKEEAPGDCHRHHTIAVPLLTEYGVDCVHVFQEQLIRASELQASIDQNRDYQFSRLALA